MTFSVHPAQILPADEDGIARAAARLAAGGIVALPTETVYGLAGNAADDRAVAAIFAAKGRPSFNPLIVHVPDLAAAERLAEFSPVARRLAERFWPGPLTLALPRRADSGLSWLVSAGLDTIAIRAPAHPVMQAMLRRTGFSLAAPSANPSGRISPTTAADVGADLADRIALVLDGGRCPVGIESTIVRIEPDGGATLLRPGGLAAEDIERITGPLGHGGQPAARPDAPGQLASHYAPHAPVRLNATGADADEALLGFGRDAPGRTSDLNLSPSGDAAEAAANLFAMLRELDRRAPRAIAVRPIPDAGLGLAINDRLRRAAAPREPVSGDPAWDIPA